MATGATHHVGAPLSTSEVEHSTTAHHVGAPLSGTTEHKGAPGRRHLGEGLQDFQVKLTCGLIDAAASLSILFRQAVHVSVHFLVHQALSAAEHLTWKNMSDLLA